MQKRAHHFSLTPPRSDDTVCPFCCQSFRRVTSCLLWCKEQNDRDYTDPRSEGSQRNKEKVPHHRKCHMWHRFFLRLDTHLCVSSTCFQHELPTPSTDTSTSSLLPCASLLQQSTIAHPLKLSKSMEEADVLLEERVVPAVLQAHLAEDKNTILSARSYEVLKLPRRRMLLGESSGEQRWDGEGPQEPCWVEDCRAMLG